MREISVVNVVEVRCEGFAQHGGTLFIEQLKDLVRQLESVQSQGYVLEDNTFWQQKAEIPRDLVFRFTRDFSAIPKEQIREELKLGFDPKILREKVEILKLSNRVMNIFRDHSIVDLSDLVSKSHQDLRPMKGMGPGSLNEICTKLRELGLDLGMKLPNDLAG